MTKVFVGSAPREDAVRAQDARQKLRDLERRAPGGHAGGPARRLRVRGEGGHRGRALRPRRRPGYPSIVGSGPNATILHYPDGARQMQAGDLLLVDAACTPRVPDGRRHAHLSGERHVLARAEGYLRTSCCSAQQEGIEAARPGASLQDIHRRTVEVIKAGLLEAGTDHRYQRRTIPNLVYARRVALHRDRRARRGRRQPCRSSPAWRSRSNPGLYIRQSRARRAAADSGKRAFIEKVQPAVRKYADIGVRIEDSFLLDESGLRNLSAALPKTIDDIEALMRRRTSEWHAKVPREFDRSMSPRLAARPCSSRSCRARRSTRSRLATFIWKVSNADRRRVSRRLHSSADQGLLSRSVRRSIRPSRIPTCSSRKPISARWRRRLPSSRC